MGRLDAPARGCEASPRARYTEVMDRVRFGRALGYGTRHAAKTVAAVVDAASAPNPAAGSVAQTRSPADTPATTRPTLREVRAAAQQPQRLRTHARALWQPLAVFSGALWLRVTGLFFALIACTLGNGAWRLRATLRAGAAGSAHRFWVFAVFAVLFAYFAISSFVRASLKERRAAAAVSGRR